VFFGTEDFSAAALKRLLANDYDLAAVITKPAAPSGRGQKLQEPVVAELVEKAKIKVFQPSKVAEINDQIANLKPTHGVLSAYGKILPESTLDLFPDGIINIHPSLLPKYRGPAPIEAAILNDDKQTGISLMQLTAGMDEGPIYAQKTVEMPPNTDRIELTHWLAEVGAVFLMENLPSILDGTLSPSPQNSDDATYTKLLKKEDGLIDFKEPAEIIERKVRTYAGWPKTRAKLHGHEVVITKSRVATDLTDGGLVIKCRPGYLEIAELIAPSGKTMSGKDFLLGHPPRHPEPDSGSIQRK